MRNIIYMIATVIFIMGVTVSFAGDPTITLPKYKYGVASWYGEPFHGNVMANGMVYNMHKMTCAHKTLPLGTLVRVTNLLNGTEVVTRVTDRGPYIKGRVLDLSYAAANRLGFIHRGIIRVKYTIEEEWRRLR